MIVFKKDKSCFHITSYTGKRAIPKKLQLMLMDMKETNPGKFITTKSSLKLEDVRITVNKMENVQV